MRTDATTIRTIAREFASSSLAKLWNFVTTDVRGALVDSLVMNHLRMADAADNGTPHTPAEIIEFRDRLVAQLEAGIPRGSAGRLRFLLESP